MQLQLNNTTMDSTDFQHSLITGLAQEYMLLFWLGNRRNAHNTGKQNEHPLFKVVLPWFNSSVNKLKHRKAGVMNLDHTCADDRNRYTANLIA